MGSPSPSPSPLLPSKRQQIINTILLSISYMLHSSILFMQSSATTLASKSLLETQGGRESLSTLPFSLLFVTAALLPPLFSFSFERFGFKLPFFTSSIIGILSSTLASLSIFWGSFPLLALSSALLGIPNTAGNFYRFAATSIVDPHLAPKAVSAVLVSGLAASFLGPFIADRTYLLLGEDLAYLGVYIAVAVTYVLLAAAMLLVRYPPRTAAKASPNHDTSSSSSSSSSDQTSALGSLEQSPAPPPAPAPARPLHQLLVVPEILVSMVTAGTSYLMMISLMAIIPLIMDDLGFEFGTVTTVMTVHGIGMFVPFFLGGPLIDLLGDLLPQILGLLLLISSALFFLLSPPAALWPYYVGMSILGLGWSLAFLSSTILLTRSYLPSERAKVQAANDVFVFGLVAVATMSSTKMYQELGIVGVASIMIGCLGIALLLAVGLGIIRMAARRKGEGDQEPTEEDPLIQS